MPDVSVWFRLTDRDRLLVFLLAEHRVLTTDQIAEVAFGSLRRAQDRLVRLRVIDVLARFRFSLPGGGTSPAHYTLGYTGVRLVAAHRAVTPPRPATHQLRLERLMESPRLRHLLGVNGFFTALAGHTRTHPEDVQGADGVGGLTSWLSERRFADTFFYTPAGEAGIRPDGYGCWEEHGRAVRFFLEYDTGTESQPTLTGKLAAYTAFDADTHGILLFSVHSTHREAHLHHALTRALPGGRHSGRQGGGGPSRAGLVIATTSRDLHHPDGPAGPVWALWRPDASGLTGAGGAARLRLADLPERGPAPVHHPPAADRPYSDADYDPDAPAPAPERASTRRRPTPRRPPNRRRLGGRHRDCSSADPRRRGLPRPAG